MNYSRSAAEMLQKYHLLSKCEQKRKLDALYKGHSRILHYLHIAGGSATPGEISNELLISSAGVAAQLRRLENKGLITREINKENRTQVIVTLTTEGGIVAEENQRSIQYDIEKILCYLGDNDVKECLRIINRLIKYS